MVSIIITTYKREWNLLFNAIKSAINQTYKDTEILLIDDNGLGSEFQKRNEEMIKGIPNVKYLPNTYNMGAQYSRNFGVLAAQGEYVAFLDDDDIWFDTKIEKQIVAFTTDNIALVFCDGFIFHGDDFDTSILYHQKISFESKLNFEQLLCEDYVGTTSQALMRKSCFAQVGLFDVAMPARQDYEMWIRVSRSFDIIGLDEPLFYHRIHAGEQISKNSYKAYIGNLNILKKYKDDYKKNKYAYARKFLRLASICKDLKRYHLYILYCIRALFKSPLKILKYVISKGGRSSVKVKR